jgi:hypothetical protein
VFPSFRLREEGLGMESPAEVARSRRECYSTLFPYPPKSLLRRVVLNMESFAQGSSYLNTPDKRTESAVRSIVASSEAEGITVNPSQIRRLAAERVRSNTKTTKSED